jgi:hypothetical protein
MSKYNDMYDKYGNKIGLTEIGCDNRIVHKGCIQTNEEKTCNNSKVCQPNTMCNPRGTLMLADGQCDLYPSFPTSLSQVLKAVPIDDCNPRSRNNIDVDWDTLSIDDIYGLRDELKKNCVKSVSVNGGQKILPDTNGNVNIQVSNSGGNSSILPEYRFSQITNNQVNLLKDGLPVSNFTFPISIGSGNTGNFDINKLGIDMFPYNGAIPNTTKDITALTLGDNSGNFKVGIQGQLTYDGNPIATAKEWVGFGEIIDGVTIRPHLVSGKLTSSPLKGYAMYRDAGSYDWIVPSNVYRIKVTAVGGGGGADISCGPMLGYFATFDGGRAGTMSTRILDVTPGQSFNLKVGAGGSVTIPTTFQFGDYIASNGVDTSFGGNLVVAQGGSNVEVVQYDSGLGKSVRSKAPINTNNIGDFYAFGSEGLGTLSQDRGGSSRGGLSQVYGRSNECQMIFTTISGGSLGGGSSALQLTPQGASIATPAGVIRYLSETGTGFGAGMASMSIPNSTFYTQIGAMTGNTFKFSAGDGAIIIEW